MATNEPAVDIRVAGDNAIGRAGIEHCETQWHSWNVYRDAGLRNERCERSEIRVWRDMGTGIKYESSFRFDIGWHECIRPVMIAERNVLIGTYCRE
ncbi:hypothetical protein A4G99_16430 [Haladaptatus sp. R4]|nr:hypothetical protein A4G99_16430 [Haladaptatus sp. R4]